MTWTRIVLARLVLCGADMRISRLPTFPILEVIHGLPDGLVQPLRGPILEVLVRIEEVLEDLGGFGMAHLVLEGQIPQLELHEVCDVFLLELVAPAWEVRRRI